MPPLRVVLPLLVFLGLAALLALGLGGNPRELPSPFIDKPAPPLDLPALEAGRRVELGALRGAPVLVNVWASWCAACRDEHPLLMALSRMPGVRILGLNYKDEPAKARQVLESTGNPYFEVAVDRSGRTGIDWGVYGVPETFLVDAQGIVRYKHVGPLTEADVREALLPRLRGLLGEAPQVRLTAPPSAAAMLAASAP